MSSTNQNNGELWWSKFTGSLSSRLTDNLKMENKNENTQTQKKKWDASTLLSNRNNTKLMCLGNHVMLIVYAIIVIIIIRWSNIVTEIDIC